MSAGLSATDEEVGTKAMMVLGADTHKGSHSIAAVSAATGEVLGDKTVRVNDAGFVALLDWARGLDEGRVWALEDCRHVSGSLERFLLVSGGRVIRVATKLMASERRGARDRGKSDVIDALAVARAALREGIESLPAAQLAGVELDIRLLVDHRERALVFAAMTATEPDAAGRRPPNRTGPPGQDACVKRPRAAVVASPGSVRRLRGMSSSTASGGRIGRHRKMEYRRSMTPDVEDALALEPTKKKPARRRRASKAKTSA